MESKTFGGMTIYNGDAFSDEATALIADESADLVLSDPPYNIGDSGKVTKSHGKIYSNKEAWGDTFKDNFTGDEYTELMNKYLSLSFRALKPGGAIVSFIDRKYAGKFIELAESHGFLYKNLICFAKINVVPKIRAYNYASAVEVAVWLHKPRAKGAKATKTKPNIFNYKKPTKNLRHPDGKLDVVEYHNTYSSNFFLYNIGRKIFGHPTEKYGGQVIPMIETHSNEGSVILDPFGGSFAIGYYAKKLGRQYIGFELSKKFFDDSIQKLEEIYGSQSKKTEEGSGGETKKTNNKKNNKRTRRGTENTSVENKNNPTENA